MSTSDPSLTSTVHPMSTSDLSLISCIVADQYSSQWCSNAPCWDKSPNISHMTKWHNYSWRDDRVCGKVRSDIQISHEQVMDSTHSFQYSFIALNFCIDTKANRSLSLSLSLLSCPACVWGVGAAGRLPACSPCGRCIKQESNNQARPFQGADPTDF